MNVIAGDATVLQMYNLGLVRTPADFYSLDKAKLLCLEGWKEKSADRFLKSLQESVNVPFEKVLFALGIRYVGEATAKSVAAHFGSMEAVAAASLEDLLSVEDVGDVIAQSIYDFFRNPLNVTMVERLREAGLQMSARKSQGPVSDVLSGKTIVISGNFSISRDDMKKLIASNGGKNSGSVSGKTAFLLAGEKPGPEKIKKADALGVPIVSEEEFMAMIGGDDASRHIQDLSGLQRTNQTPEVSEPHEGEQLSLF